MTGTLRGELKKLQKRPVTWVVSILALYFTLFEYYAIGYLTYKLNQSGVTSARVPLRTQLEQMSPELVIENLMASLTGYIILIAIIYGALVAGNEYGLGTLKTITTQHPSRLKIYLAQTLAVWLFVALMLISMLVISLGAATMIAISEGGNHAWPPASDLVRSSVDGWIVLVVWASVGMTLATIFRSSATAIGVGIAWAEIVEGIIIGFLSLQYHILEKIQEWLPLANTQTLAWSWGMPGIPDDAEVLLPVSGPQYNWMSILFLAVFISIGACVFNRRDVV